ncbi:MAG TPA: L-fucose:H+ symporter permease [Steroidobacteraceae bacterium]|jgi:FHS family L-fucose permease-like MFS transporter|nr:L-fucose:H+ symporter permease [Steroidobacteraceae bacterium]
MNNPQNVARWPLFLITALFLFWGVANNLNDILIPQFKKAFTLTDFESGFVQSFFYVGYFTFALPAGFFIRKYGYKAAVVMGLCLFAAGALMFYPASQAAEYRWFLAALFVIASGLAFLETSANPLITALGPQDRAAYRLNLAQSFNPLGALTGVFIGRTFILSGKEVAPDTMDAAAQHAFYLNETRAVQGPYLFLGLFILAWAVLVALSKFPAEASRESAQRDASKLNAKEALTGLFAHKHFLNGVLAQFFYVGAQVGIWSYTIRYAQAELGLTDKTAAIYVLVSLGLFWIGRVVGTMMISKMPASRVLGTFALCNIALTAYAASVGGQSGLYALVAASFFMSIMFPTIFAVAIEDLGPLAKTGSSLLVMSIIGGAVITAIMGKISDLSHIRTAIFMPVLCFAVIAWYGWASPKVKTALKGH